MSNSLSMEQVYNFVNEIAGRHNQIKTLLEQASVLQNDNALAINGFVNLIAPKPADAHEHAAPEAAAPAAAPLPNIPRMPTPAAAPATHGPGHNVINLPSAAAPTPQPQPKDNLLASSVQAMHDAVNKLAKPADAPPQPTPAVMSAPVTAAVAEAPVKTVLEEMREGWHGPRSIIGQLLSPVAYTGGRGFLSPSTTQIYNEDVMRTPLKMVTSWPTGFYTDEATKEMQFLLNLPSVSIFVEKLPSSTGDVWVTFKTPQGVTSRININDIINEHEMKFALDSVWTFLQEAAKPQA